MKTLLAMLLLIAGAAAAPPVNREGRKTTAPAVPCPRATGLTGDRPLTVLFVEDPGYPIFGPAVKPDRAWRDILARIFGDDQYGWFGPTSDPNENGPDLSVMQNYKLVIWNIYDYWWGAPQGYSAGLTVTDQSNLQDYLADEGQVWLIGQDLILSGVPAGWLAANMHLAASVPDYWHGSPVTAQDRLRSPFIQLGLRTDYQANVFWPDELVPDSQAAVAFKDTDHDKAIGIAAPVPSPYRTAFWTIDGRNPDPVYYWEYIVRKMFVAFGLPVAIVDAGVVAIDLPAVIFENTLWQPRAEIKNYGTDTMPIQAVCRIEPGGFLSQLNLTLPPDSTRSVLFPDTFLFTQGFFTVTVYTSLSGDMDPRNDTFTVLTEATNWLYYDDGFVANVWAWDDENNGWGVQFPVGSECRVDSIAVYIGNDTWPLPGGDTATFRMYSGLAGPESLRWELSRTRINRGLWNIIPVDTSQTLFTAGENIYVFYIQVGDLPLCPGLAYDRYVNFPMYMWQLYNDSFSITLPGGDWLIRCHIKSYAGIQDEKHDVTRNDMMQAPAFLRPGASVIVTLEKAAQVKLSLYDIAGCRRYEVSPGLLPMGRHKIPFYAAVPSGIYFIVLQTSSSAIKSRKTVVIQ